MNLLKVEKVHGEEHMENREILTYDCFRCISGHLKYLFTLLYIHNLNTMKEILEKVSDKNV